MFKSHSRWPSVTVVKTNNLNPNFFSSRSTTLRPSASCACAPTDWRPASPEGRKLWPRLDALARRLTTRRNDAAHHSSLSDPAHPPVSPFDLFSPTFISSVTECTFADTSDIFHNHTTVDGESFQSTFVRCCGRSRRSRLCELQA